MDCRSLVWNSGSKRSKEGAGTPQNAGRRSLTSPHTSPRRPTNRPKTAPRRPQGGPNAAQDAFKTPQNTPMTPTRRPQAPPRRPKRPPRPAHTSILLVLGDDLGSFLDWCLKNFGMLWRRRAPKYWTTFPKVLNNWRLDIQTCSNQGVDKFRRVNNRAAASAVRPLQYYNRVWYIIKIEFESNFKWHNILQKETYYNKTL